MNIFYVDKDPVIAAQMLCDSHCVKMILESAQMLSTAHRVLDGKEYIDESSGRKIKRWRLDDPIKEKSIYKAGWLKHPSTQWVMESAYNYRWLYNHMMALNEEFKRRYPKKGRDHMCVVKLGEILKTPPKNIDIRKIGTDAPTAMPEECRVAGDSVTSYRKYYILKKRSFATWKSPAKMPDWFKKGVEIVEAKNGV